MIKNDSNRLVYMKTSEKGVRFIAEFEGFRADAYLCPAGVPTIGYGHTKGVELGDTISEEEALALLHRELEEYEGYVANMVRVDLRQHEFDALVSFIYNIGPSNFGNSSTLKYLNNNNRLRAGDRMLVWNKARDKNGRLRTLRGLSRRRKSERKLFLYKKYGAIENE